MKTSIQFFISLIAGILLICSCKKDSPKVTPTPPPAPVVKGPFLYIGGISDSKGIYWKFSLSQPSANVIADTVQNSTNISSIVISDSTRYMVGGSAGYWKNDSFVAVRGASQLNLLAVSGTNVYTEGLDMSFNLAQWTNNTESENLTSAMTGIFTSADLNYGLTGMAVSGSNVIISGTLVVEGVPGEADSTIYSGFGVLCTNGVAQLLPYLNYTFFGGMLFQWTSGVAVSGNDIYVAGTLPDTTSVPKGGFWKNGVWNSINNGLFHPAAIVSSDSNVVITGYTYTLPWNPSSMHAAYWQNGNLTDCNGTNGIMVAVYGGDVYVLGQDNSGNIVVWKNGSLFKTLNGTIIGSVSCMAVGDL
jgi:hypothetical protein